MIPRLAAFVVTYRREGVLPATVASLLAQTRPPDHVLVVDNGATAEAEAAIRGIGDPRLTYCAMSDNLGPAGAIAFALRRLRDEGWDWILWGDDDDPPRTPDVLRRLCRLVEEDDAPDLAGVAAVGVRWDWRRGESRRLADADLRGRCEIDVAGGGQHLMVRGALLSDDRLPAPELFFGLDDFDFCLRLRRGGLRLAVDGELMLEYRRLAGRLGLGPRPRRGASAPAAWRRYYTTRNYIHLMRRTFDRADLARRETVKAAARSALAWRRGVRYGRRVTALQFAAVRDGFAGRLGRTVEPGGYPPPEPSR